MPEYYRCANDQENRNRELNYNKRTADAFAFYTCPDFPFQYFNYVEGSKVKGRVAASQDTHKYYQQECASDKLKVVEGLKGELFSGKKIKRWEKYVTGSYCRAYCHHAVD